MNVLKLVAEGTQSLSLALLGGTFVFTGGLTGLGYVVFGLMFAGGILGISSTGYKAYKLWSNRPKVEPPTR